MRLGKVGEPTFTENAIDKFEFGKPRYLIKGNDCNNIIRHNNRNC